MCVILVALVALFARVGLIASALNANVDTISSLAPRSVVYLVLQSISQITRHKVAENATLLVLLAPEAHIVRVLLAIRDTICNQIPQLAKILVRVNM